uniref:Uncharacterized protein n=1 Tax=viral metagenome TaxID=1070528 RepID=A0A6C0F7W3_9ZZZZ|tara:strand:+ start:964 stop:1659 length:696 start_codon:yes stop_codon:yes gene_type:complete
MSAITNKHAGKVRVSRQASNKNYVKHKQKSVKKDVTLYKKLLEPQKHYLKEGISPEKYKSILQDKCNKEHHHYKSVTDEMIDMLVSRYATKVSESIEKTKALRKEKEKKRQMRKMISETRAKLVEEKDKELRKEITKHLLYLGHVKKKDKDKDKVTDETPTQEPSEEKPTTEPKQGTDQGELTSVIGGKYLEAHDTKWTNLYQKLVADRNCLKFDIADDADWYQFLKNGGK